MDPTYKGINLQNECIQEQLTLHVLVAFEISGTVVGLVKELGETTVGEEGHM